MDLYDFIPTHKVHLAIAVMCLCAVIVKLNSGMENKSAIMLQYILH